MSKYGCYCRMRTNRDELTWIIYHLSGMWAMMDDTGYPDFDDVNQLNYTELDYVRGCEREAFVCIERATKLLIEGKDALGNDLESKPHLDFAFYHSGTYPKRTALYLLRDYLGHWGCNNDPWDDESVNVPSFLEPDYEFLQDPEGGHTWL